MATQLFAVGLVIFGTFVMSFGTILLKKGSSKQLLKISSLATNYSLMGGVALYGIGTMIFIPALKRGDLSVLYPFAALSYIWVSLLSVKFLGERMNKLKWLGIVLIIIGVAFIGIGSQ